MAESDDVLRTIERIYVAVAAPDLWSTAMESIAELVGADHTVVMARAATDGESHFVAHARLDPRDIARAHEGARHCNLDLVPPMPPGVVVPRSSLIPDREYSRSRHYNEVVRPVNGFHALGAQQASPTIDYVLAACRGPRRDDFSAADSSSLQRMLPHLATALALRAQLRDAVQRAQELAVAFDCLDVAAILVDASGKPTFINRRAAALMAQRDGLSVERPGLAGATPADTWRLRRALEAILGGGSAGEQSLRLPRPSGRPPLLLTLLPQPPLTGGATDLPPSRVAVFVREPDDPVAIDREALADAYRLTRRESEVAVLLAGGAGLPAIASMLGLGPGTARYHLKNALSKTNARNQAALVALVRGFALPTQSATATTERTAP